MWWLFATALAWEFHGEVGAEINQAPFGVFNAGARTDKISIELITDTIDVRWTPTFKKGRAWLGFRGEFGFAYMFQAPWANGEPRRDLGYNAFYEGAEAGVIGYLPAGFYAGVDTTVRFNQFASNKATQVAVPESVWLMRTYGILGFYHENAHLWVRAGGDVLDFNRFLPRVEGMFELNLPGSAAPIMEVRGAWAQDATDLTRTRLGGLNPYVVPLAGLGWGEFWVKNYMATRVGAEGRWHADKNTFKLGLASDLDWFDDQFMVGFSANFRWEKGPWFVETAYGWAPWADRPQGSVAMSGWLLGGFTWTDFKKAK